MAALTETFNAFYRREYPQALRLAFLLTRSQAVADDVVQEAFAAVYRRYDDIGNPGGYLRVTVVNNCNRWHRSARREDRRLRLSAASLSGPAEPDHLTDALAGLPYRQRAVLVLRYWGGHSEAEIAQILDCRPGTVKSLASRALRRLRSEIQ